VALDGLGSSVAGGAVINSPAVMLGNESGVMALASFLDLYDFFSEGVMMPLGALVMSLIIGWMLKKKVLEIKEEVEAGGGVKMKFYQFWQICFQYLVPLGMAVVLLGQLDDFLSLGLF
jgi:NSS family neurotransmitter:Na+ symporter